MLIWPGNGPTSKLGNLFIFSIRIQINYAEQYGILACWTRIHQVPTSIPRKAHERWWTSPDGNRWLVTGDWWRWEPLTLTLSVDIHHRIDRAGAISSGGYQNDNVAMETGAVGARTIIDVRGRKGRANAGNVASIHRVASLHFTFVQRGAGTAQ